MRHRPVVRRPLQQVLPTTNMATTEAASRLAGPNAQAVHKARARVAKYDKPNGLMARPLPVRGFPATGHPTLPLNAA